MQFNYSTLNVLVRAIQRGATAEEIALDFPSLQLAGVYQAIGYYFQHAAELEPYVESREQDAAQLLSAHEDSWAPKGLRERLLARRVGL